MSPAEILWTECCLDVVRETFHRVGDWLPTQQGLLLLGNWWGPEKSLLNANLKSPIFFVGYTWKVFGLFYPPQQWVWQSYPGKHQSWNDPSIHFRCINKISSGVPCSRILETGSYGQEYTNWTHWSINTKSQQNVFRVLGKPTET